VPDASTVEDSFSIESVSSAAPLDPTSAIKKTISDRCDMSVWFKNVSSEHDLAVLEFLAGKLFQAIKQQERKRKAAFPNGILVEAHIWAKHSKKCTPLVLKIPQNMTVFGLREELALRLSRSLKSDCPALNAFGSPALQVLRRVPLSFHRNCASCRHDEAPCQLGSIAARPSASRGALQRDVRERSPKFACPDHSKENEIVAELVGDMGQVVLDLPDDDFDVFEYESVEVPIPMECSPQNTVELMDCIDKFCQMEQLEESDEGCCDQCRRNYEWRQLRIFRSPPHLIVHLRRFQRSSHGSDRQKIGVHVHFPLEGLDLSNHVTHWSDGEKPVYDCYAVSNHYDGLGGGHYTAFTLTDGGVWCHYDDETIMVDVDPSEVTSPAAYILYYRRRDVPAGLDLDRPTPIPIPDLMTGTTEESSRSTSPDSVPHECS
jgi:Ubiquitin carboxyl-terminal hydrolase